MMPFLWGALAVLALGLILSLILDEEVREAALTLGWAVLFGTPLVLVLAFAAVLSRLPAPIRPRRVRGRRLSVRALQRVADRAAHDGWMVSSPARSIIVLKRRR